jgi:transcriptional regulator with XRE-family HTH domain
MSRDHPQSGLFHALIRWKYQYGYGDTSMAHPADVAVGKRLRLRRKELGLSQTALATDIEISAQKLRRYERGDDRMRTRDLFRAARRLEVAIGYFFRDLAAYRDDEPEDRDLDLVRQGLKLLKLFCEIPDSEARTQLIQLVRHAGREERPHRHV